MPEMNVLTVENLFYSYPDEKTAAVDEVSFCIKRASYTAIAGKNGSGKSTLARIIAGLLEADGTIRFDNVRVGIVFQSPKDQIICGTLEKDTAFGPENMNLSAQEVKLRTETSLKAVGMTAFAHKSCFSLSLGQLQKAALSGMLALDVQFLILDEALAMIDESARNHILTLLDSLHAQGMTILHITHDIKAVRRAQNVMVMDNGKLAWQGSVKEFFENPALVKKIAGQPLTVRTPLTSPPPAEKITLSAQKIAFSYQHSAVLDGISFNLYKGTLTALTGKSGGGKTTLFEILAGLLEPDCGTVFSDTRAALVQQNSDAALFETFAADDVAFGVKNAGITGKDCIERVKTAMNAASLPFLEFADRRTFYLSGGQKRRLAIAGILALNPDILLFDEPTAGLDGSAKHEIMTLLKTLAESGKTVVYSTHYADEAAFADRIICLAKGAIVSDTLFPPDKMPDSQKNSDSFSEKNAALYRKTICQKTAGTPVNLKVQPPQKGASFLQSIRDFSNSCTGKANASAPLAKLPAPVKYLLFLSLFSASLAVNSARLSILMLFSSIGYALLSGGGRRLFSMMVKVIPFLSFFAVFQMIFACPLDGERIFFHWKFFTISPSKLFSCLAILLHTESALCVMRGFGSSMTEQDIISGFEDLLFPLKKLKIPVRYASVTVEIMFRFIPLLTDEAECIIKTQLVRGGLKNSKGALSRIRAMLPLLVPLIIRTIRRAEALADALTVRGFK